MCCGTIDSDDADAWGSRHDLICSPQLSSALFSSPLIPLLISILAVFVFVSFLVGAVVLSPGQEFLNLKEHKAFASHFVPSTKGLILKKG